jgi:hypothetical protein
MLTGGLLSMLLHATALQHRQQQRRWPQNQQGMLVCGGVQELLLSMLAVLAPQVKDPQQQQVLLSALNPAARTSQPQQLQQGHGTATLQAASSATRTTGSNAGWCGRAQSPWDVLRQQLSAAHSPALAAAASRALIAASNRLVAAAAEGADGNGNGSSGGSSAAAGGSSGSSGKPGGVVLPQQQQEALVAAELMQALLLFALLWPDLTVRRLLQDGVTNRCACSWNLQLQLAYLADSMW